MAAHNPTKKRAAMHWLAGKTTSKQQHLLILQNQEQLLPHQTNHFETNNVRSHLNNNLSNQWAF
jgi:hypothetical protein